ncbi:hypothetical protein [Acetobacterium malicum]|uniref:hypothetical protein n=1 Tax=Acetobacterium malicum TaxID=52692 RepID=UPI00047D02C6|nr:hypothetical protein [Acetobacterium dehalogenans]
MANKTGSQPYIMFCPICKGDLVNIPRNEMKSKGYIRKDGTVSQFTHTYECKAYGNTFEINQDR